LSKTQGEHGGPRHSNRYDLVVDPVPIEILPFVRRHIIHLVVFVHFVTSLSH
jgi:hypothetical protein